MEYVHDPRPTSPPIQVCRRCREPMDRFGCDAPGCRSGSYCACGLYSHPHRPGERWCRECLSWAMSQVTERALDLYAHARQLRRARRALLDHMPYMTRFHREPLNDWQRKCRAALDSLHEAADDIVEHARDEARDAKALADVIGVRCHE